LPIKTLVETLKRAMSASLRGAPSQPKANMIHAKHPESS
jgi:hypothetical protein